VARRKDLEDNPIPAGNSSAAFGLLRLAALSGEHEYERHADGVFALLARIAPQHPQAFAHLLQAIDFAVEPTREVALVGEELEPLDRVVRARFRPHLVMAGRLAGDGYPDADSAPALLRGRTTVDGQSAAYVCENFACQRPVTEPGELAGLLGG
jgi:uncharacterized protein YyaL (SSP411 family)